MKGEGVQIGFEEIKPGDRILCITRYVDGMATSTEGVVIERQEWQSSWWTESGDMVASAEPWGKSIKTREFWLVERPGPKEPIWYGAIVKFGGADPHMAVLAPVRSPKQWVGLYANYTWAEILAMGDVEVISEGVDLSG